MVKTLAATALAMAAFAANSILCRLALKYGGMDAASFTLLRLSAGAALLALGVRLSASRRAPHAAGSWLSAVCLTTYAVAFSYAYLRLDTGTGALILFCAVQVSMIGYGLHAGERPHPLQWSGLALALGGLAYLLLPGLSAPSPAGALLMAAAGVAWGVYSLMGRGAAAPVLSTAGNFVRSVPLVLAVWLLFGTGGHSITGEGAVWALLSGALASGAGYVLWYAALPGLTATTAALVQLSVPVLAAAGGVTFLSETVTARLALSAAAVLGGVAMAVVVRPRVSKQGT